MDLTCRFVLKNGETIGESISEFEGYLIVKVSDKFIGIPKRCVSFDGENIHVSDFDYSEAEEVGRKWLSRSKPVSYEKLKDFGFLS